MRKDVFSQYSEIHDLPDTAELFFMKLFHDSCIYLNGDKDIGFYGNITILIPCYNKSNFIEKTVLSCVNQTIKVNTIVLLMDEKSKTMKNKLESLGNVKCIIHDRMNVCAARTFLVDNCSTDWFVFLDGDDVLDKNFCEVLSKKNGAIRFSGTSFYENNLKPKPVFQRLREHNITNVICYNNTCLMHKDVFYDIGYDEELCNGAEDTDFLLRLIDKRKWKISFTTDTKFIYNFDTENQLTKDYSKFCPSLEKCIIKNKDILINGILKANHKISYQNYLIYVLKNYNHKLFLSFIDFMENKINLNVRFNIILNEYLEKNIIKNNNLTFPLLLKYGRILYLEDIVLYMNEFKKYSPKELFQYLSENDILITGVNDRKKIIRNDDDFINIVGNMEFPEDIQKYIDIWKLRKYFLKASEINEMQKCSFVFSKKCNKHCDYCFQEKNEKQLTEEELFSNFNKALSKFEKITNNNVYPIILGGEPTLFSDSLIKKILNRLKDYKKIVVLTNDTSFKSLWYSDERVVTNNHIVDWVEHDRSYYPDVPGSHYVIVVTHKDIDHLEKFFDTQGHNKFLLNPCFSENQELNTTEEDKIKIAKIAIKYNLLVDMHIDTLQYGFTEMKNKCRLSNGTWDYDCTKDKVAICCGTKHVINLEDFTGNEKIENCNRCYNFGNMY